MSSCLVFRSLISIPQHTPLSVLPSNTNNSETSDLDSQITPVKLQADVATDEFPNIMDMETEQFPMRCRHFLYKPDVASIRESE